MRRGWTRRFEPVSAQPAASKPNIVFIVMDNLGYGEVGEHPPIAPGTPDPYTPQR